MFTQKRKFSQKRAFVFLLVIGLLVWSFKLLQTYLIFKGYKNPPPLVPYPSLFEYSAFSVVAFLFPYSWNLFKTTRKRAIAVGLSAVLFAVIYIFILNFLEWAFGFSVTRIWNGFVFSLQHASLMVLLSYSVIGVVLMFFGINQERPDQEITYLDRLSYKSKGKTFVVDVSDILFFESSDNYVSIHFGDGRYELIRKPLSDLEKQLDPAQFQRVHRKFIVNLDAISSLEVNASGSTEVEVSSGKKLKVSKTYRSKLRSAIR
ncbi:MAG: LytTR family DNA-binding domain-containing protein [Cyclobacteriaceae bacterium]